VELCDMFREPAGVELLVGLVELSLLQQPGP
jgi:hypothetical protein